MSLHIDKGTWTGVKLGDVVRNVNESVKDPASIGIDRTIGLEHIESGNFEVQGYGTLDEGVSFTRRVRVRSLLPPSMQCALATSWSSSRRTIDSMRVFYLSL